MKNNIRKEIAEFAPILTSLEKHNPFLVPEGYFSSLENQVLDTIDKKPLLSSTPPDGYFDNLSDKVLERIQSEDKAKVIPFYRNRWISIAASFIILIGAAYLWHSQADISGPNTEFALDVEPEEALEYLIENENIYLSDLLSLEIYEEDSSDEAFEITDFEDVDIDELLDELDQEDLEELL